MKKDLPDSDGRSRASRRWRSLFSEYLAARGPLNGRHDVATRSAAKCAASLTMLLEKMDSDILAGRPCPPEVYSRTSNSLARHLAFLGIEYVKPELKPKEEPNPVRDYLKTKETPQ